MQRPPRPRSERLFNWPLALRAYLFLGLIEAAAAMAAFFVVLHRGGWSYGERLAPHDPLYLQATTACLSAVIVMQIVNVSSCRSPNRSVLSTGLRGNADPVGRRARDRADPADRLHAVGQSPPRNRAHRAFCVVTGRSVRSRGCWLWKSCGSCWSAVCGPERASIAAPVRRYPTIVESAQALVACCRQPGGLTCRGCRPRIPVTVVGPELGHGRHLP